MNAPMDALSAPALGSDRRRNLAMQRKRRDAPQADIGTCVQLEIRSAFELCQFEQYQN